MKTKIEEMFSLLSENKINFYLLRPIDFKDEIKDLDIIVSRVELNKLIELLLQKYQKIQYRKSHANASIQIIANEVLLDIKFSMCFLSGKSLVLRHNIPYAGVKYIQKDILIPNVSGEILFTFWTFHLFLDKVIPEHSSTFDTYKQLYKEEWNTYLDTDFFLKWAKIIFKDNDTTAIKIIETYFTNNMVLKEQTENNSLKKLLFKSRPLLLVKYFFDKIKYALYRRLNIYGNYKQITKTTN